jgi:hypothetical protein
MRYSYYHNWAQWTAQDYECSVCIFVAVLDVVSTRSEPVVTQLGHPRLEQFARGPFEWQRVNIPLSRQSFSKVAGQYAIQMAHPRLEQFARGALELQGVNI